MARIPKTGLSYFPLDLDFFDDPKLLRIEDEFKHKGGYICIRLLMWIYRDGYYCKWDEDASFIFAKRVGNDITGSLVNEVVKGLIKCGFFDKTMFDSFKILTSEGIQKRWMKIIEECNRAAKIEPDYDLTGNHSKFDKSDKIPEKSDKIEIKSDFMPEKSEDMQQRKGKEIKGKESKEEKLLSKKEKLSTKETNITSPADAAEGKRFDFIDSLLAIFSEEYKISRGNEYDYQMAIGKERNMMGKILQRYKSKDENKSKNTEETKSGMRKWFKVFLEIDSKSMNGKWHHANMSPSHIVDNYNSLITIIKGNKNGKAGKISSFESANESNKGKFDKILTR